MKRFIEFFEGENKRLSMTRLLMFFSFGPATYFMLKSNDTEALVWYLGAYVLGYAAGKGADMISRKVGSE